MLIFERQQSDGVKRRHLCQQETHLETNLLAIKTIDKGDLVTPNRNLAALGNLYHSVVMLIQMIA